MLATIFDVIFSATFSATARDPEFLVSGLAHHLGQLLHALEEKTGHQG